MWCRLDEQLNSYILHIQGCKVILAPLFKLLHLKIQFSSFCITSYPSTKLCAITLILVRFIHFLDTQVLLTFQNIGRNCFFRYFIIRCAYTCVQLTRSFPLSKICFFKSFILKISNPVKPSVLSITQIHDLVNSTSRSMILFK